MERTDGALKEIFEHASKFSKGTILVNPEGEQIYKDGSCMKSDILGVYFEINYYSTVAVDEIGRRHPTWFYDLFKNIGKTTKDGEKFIGVQETNEDYYYILDTGNGIVYHSCVGHLEFVD